MRDGDERRGEGYKLPEVKVTENSFYEFYRVTIYVITEIQKSANPERLSSGFVRLG
jgi:hypothetical protein